MVQNDGVLVAAYRGMVCWWLHTEGWCAGGCIQRDGVLVAAYTVMVCWSCEPDPTGITQASKVWLCETKGVLVVAYRIQYMLNHGFHICTYSISLQNMSTHIPWDNTHMRLVRS